jgi:hypothetical protein
VYIEIHNKCGCRTHCAVQPDVSRLGDRNLRVYSVEAVGRSERLWQEDILEFVSVNLLSLVYTDSLNTTTETSEYSSSGPIFRPEHQNTRHPDRYFNPNIRIPVTRTDISTRTSEYPTPGPIVRPDHQNTRHPDRYFNPEPLRNGVLVVNSTPTSGYINFRLR